MQTVKTVIFTFIFLTITTFTGVIIFIYSGIFNVSAGSKEEPLLYGLIKTIRDRSITLHAKNITVPSKLNDPAVVMEGFTHYQEMCVSCHRAPGLEASEISKGLNPTPPNFSRMKKLGMSPAELFWVIKNGIRMTGMPAWGITHDDEKIWAITAFVTKLPSMTQAEYQAMNQKVGEKKDHHHMH